MSGKSGKKKKKSADQVSLLSGMMVTAIVLAVVFYGTVAFATVRNGGTEPGSDPVVPSSTERRTDAPETTKETPTEPGTEGQTEAVTEPVTEAPTAAPIETVSPKEVRTEERTASEIRIPEALPTNRIAQIEKEYDMGARLYAAEYPAVLSADGRAAAADALIDEFGEIDTEVTVYCSSPDEKKVSFVFNAGGDPGCTEQVLDVLKTYGIRSTFYVSHYYAVHSTDLVKQMIADGHEIGNLSYSNPAAGMIDNKDVSDVMTDALNQQTYMRTVFHTELQKYSFPADSYSEATVKMLTEVGYRVCFPSVHLNDADPDTQYQKTQLIAALEASLHPGAVYEFHLVNGIAAQILPDLISYATREGYVIKQLD